MKRFLSRTIANQTIALPTVETLPDLKPTPIQSTIHKPIVYVSSSREYIPIKPTIVSAPPATPMLVSSPPVPVVSGSRYETKIFPTTLYAGTYDKPMFVPSPLSSITVGTLIADEIYTRDLNASTVTIDNQVLTANAEELLLNGIPLATLSNLSSIADWSYVSAVSTIQVNGNNIVDANTIYTSSLIASSITTNVLHSISTIETNISTTNIVGSSATFSSLNGVSVNSLVSSVVGNDVSQWANYSAVNDVIVRNHKIYSGYIPLTGSDNDLNLEASRYIVNKGAGMCNIVDMGPDVGTNAFYRVSASNGNRGEISLSAYGGVLGAPGQIGLYAYGGSVPDSQLGTGGLIELTAYTNATTLANATSAVKLSGASVVSYAGITPIFGSLAGYNYIHGDLGVNLTAGLPSVIPNVPGSTYIYGTSGVVLESGSLADVKVKDATLAVNSIKPRDDTADNLVIRGRVNALTTNQYVDLQMVNTLDMDGNTCRLSNVKTLAMSNGAITGVQTINGQSYPPPSGSGGIQTLVGGSNITITNASTINLNDTIQLSSMTAMGTFPPFQSTIIGPGSNYSSVTILVNSTTTPWFQTPFIANRQEYIAGNDWNMRFITNSGTYTFLNVPQFSYMVFPLNSNDTFINAQTSNAGVWGNYWIQPISKVNVGGVDYIQNGNPYGIDNFYEVYGDLVSTISTIPGGTVYSKMDGVSVSTQQLFVSSINGQQPIFGGSGGIQSLVGGSNISITNASTINLNTDVGIQSLTVSTINGQIPIFGGGGGLPDAGSQLNYTGSTLNVNADLAVSSLTTPNVLMNPSTILKAETAYPELQVYNSFSASTGQVLASAYKVGGFNGDPNNGLYTRDVNNRAVFVGSNQTVNRLAYTNDPTLVVSTLTASQFVSTPEFYVSTIINNNFVNNTTTTNDAFFSTIKFRNGAGTAQISQPSTVGANSQPAGRFLFNQDIDVGTNELWCRRLRVGIQNPPANSANEVIFYDSIGGRQIGLQTANNDRTLRINDNISPGFSQPGYINDTRLNPIICSSITGNPITNTALQCLFPSTTQNTIGISTLSLFPAPLPLTQYGVANFSNAPSTFTVARPYKDTNYTVQITPQADTSGQIPHATILSPSTFTAHAGSGSAGVGFFWMTLGNNY